MSEKKERGGPIKRLSARITKSKESLHDSSEDKNEVKPKKEKSKLRKAAKKKKKREQKETEDVKKVESPETKESVSVSEDGEVSISTEENNSTKTEISASEVEETQSLKETKVVSEQVESEENKQEEKVTIEVPNPITLKTPKTSESPQDVAPIQYQPEVIEDQDSTIGLSPPPMILPNLPVSGKGRDITPESSPDDYLGKLDQLVRSFRTHRIQYRLNQLRNLYFTLKDNGDIFNTGTKHVTFLNDIIHTMIQLINWNKPEPIKPLPLSLAMNPVYVERIPYGLVLLVGENFEDVADALVGCIASGNCCVVKLNEDKQEIGELLNNTVEPIHVVHGGEEELNKLLQQNYDKLVNLKQGVEQTIAVTTASILTPVIHETGKCPVIILNDMDETGIKVACQRISWGCGQYGGVDYVLIPESLHDIFIKEIKLVEPIPKIEKVNSKEESKDDISEFEAHGKLPTMLDMASWRDLSKPGDTIPVITYTNLYETCDTINKTHSAHTIYVFTNSSVNKSLNAQFDYIASKIPSKGLIINDVLPIGLVDAPSGSIYGWFRKLTHERTTIEQYLWNDWLFKARYSPFSPNKEEIISCGEGSFGGRVWFGRDEDVPMEGPTEVFRTWTGILGVIGFVWKYIRG